VIEYLEQSLKTA